MKFSTKYKFIIISFYLNFKTAIADNWVFNWVSWDVKSWDIHLADVPIVIWNLIQFSMWIAMTVSIIFIIIWAYKMLFWSLEWENSKWKETVFMAIWWFALAALAWLIMKFVFTNLN